MRILPTPRPGHAAGGWGKIGGAEPVPLGNLVGSTVSARFSEAGRLGGGRRPEMSPYGGRILRHAISFYRFILRLCIDARGFQPYSFSPFRGMVRLPIVLRHLLLGRYPGDGPCRSLGSFLRFPGEIRLKSLPAAGRLIESRGNSLPRFRGYPQGPQASSAPRGLLFRSDSSVSLHVQGPRFSRAARRGFSPEADPRGRMSCVPKSKPGGPEADRRTCCPA